MSTTEQPKLDIKELVFRYIAMNKAKGIIESGIENIKAQQIVEINKLMAEQNLSADEAVKNIPVELQMENYQLRAEQELNMDLVDPEMIVYKDKLKSTTKMPDCLKPSLYETSLKISIKQTKFVKEHPEILKLIEKYSSVEPNQYQNWLDELKSYISDDEKILLHEYSTRAEEFDELKEFINFSDKKSTVNVEYGIYDVSHDLIKASTLDDLIETVPDSYQTKLNLLDSGEDLSKYVKIKFSKEAVMKSTYTGFDGIKYGDDLRKNAVEYVNAIISNDEKLIAEVRDRYFEIIKKK